MPLPPAGEDKYQVDFTIGTGAETRYERIAGIDSRDYYADWQGRTARMLSYTSAPLSERRGARRSRPRRSLALLAASRDLALFVYLTEVEAGGTERYVTEGLLRALHRRGTAGARKLSHDLAVPQLYARRCRAAGAGQGRAHPDSSVAGGVALLGRQPHPPVDRGRR